MTGQIRNGQMIDAECEGQPYTFHITLVGETDSKEYAVYEYHDSGLIVSNFSPKSPLTFIPATAIKTIQVEYN